MITWPVILAGAVTGLGVATLVRALIPAPPDLRSALDRLDPTRTPNPAATWSGPAWASRATGSVLPRAVEALRLTRYATDLRVVGLTPEDLALRKAGYTLLGAVFPALFTLAVAAVGVRLPIIVPAAASLILGAVFFALPDVDLRRRATEARAEMRRAACAYLELVALERAADAGTVEALDRAASIGGSAEFATIRDALLRAELAGQPPWTGLTALAEQVGVPELGDLADIMRLSGEDGAAVYATLRARASSLRTQLLTAATAKANAASEHMFIPAAMLGVSFMALIGYPAFSRILLG